MKKIGCLCLSIFACFSLMADEGMWMLNSLKKDNLDRMKELGFAIPEELLYDEANPSLRDAVVHFDGGCTGITVSNLGLVFTNHHCGYDAIQSQSSVEHDYLKDGFIAQTQAEEIPITGLNVRYLIQSKDITRQILDSITGITDINEKTEKIQQVIRILEDSLSDKSRFIETEISPYFNGNAYFLNVYEIYNDIRMVFAPPSSIGKFGGDTDNWMWPRHTGDFSVFRVYANRENKPAAYNEANIPYTPKYVAPISLNGYKENDFSMTIGFPGRTNRYLSSWGIRQKVESSNIPRIKARGIKQEILEESMLNSDEIRIKYSSKHAQSSNYWKNSIGMNRGIERMHVIERKETLETQFSEWVSQDTGRIARYGKALNLIRESYTETNEMREAFTYLYETVFAGSELTGLASVAMKYDVTDSKEQQTAFLEEKLRPAYKDYDPELDRKVTAAMLKLAKEKIPEPFLPHIYKEIDKKYKGDYDRYTADLFSKSVVPHLDQLEKILQDPKKIKKLEKDPACQLATSVRESLDATILGMKLFLNDLNEGERLFFAGIQEMTPGKIFAADANSTMRMSYGNINGYKPYDGGWYDYYTTEKGIFEKYRKDDPEFDVQPEILILLQDKDFGRYANSNGTLNLCFLSNNDITGGNSGSPMFDSKGRVIGLAFDGNWEAMSGDIAFEPEVQKTIGVDIRYILFVIEKWGKCDRLIKELKIESEK